jgi:Flp pilus assembly CpaF family ATPase
MVLFVAAVVKARRRRTHTGGPGSGATGAIYDMLNEDKRKAIEIIVEEKAEARDPETADGNLPELERPK